GARLEQQYPVGAAFGQARGDHRARRTRTDNDVVIGGLAGHAFEPLLIRRFGPSDLGRKPAQTADGKGMRRLTCARPPGKLRDKAHGRIARAPAQEQAREHTVAYTPRKELRYEKRDRKAYLTLNRPDQMNALNTELRLAINAAIEDGERDDDILVFIVIG